MNYRNENWKTAKRSSYNARTTENIVKLLYDASQSQVVLIECHSHETGWWDACFVLKPKHWRLQYHIVWGVTNPIWRDNWLPEERLGFVHEERHTAHLCYRCAKGNKCGYQRHEVYPNVTHLCAEGEKIMFTAVGSNMLVTFRNWYYCCTLGPCSESRYRNTRMIMPSTTLLTL